MGQVLDLKQTMLEVFDRRILLALHHACVRDARYCREYGALPCIDPRMLARM